MILFYFLFYILDMWLVEFKQIDLCLFVQKDELDKTHDMEWQSEIKIVTIREIKDDHLTIFRKE